MVDRSDAELCMAVPGVLRLDMKVIVLCLLPNLLQERKYSENLIDLALTYTTA